MTRMGKAALDHLNGSADFVPGMALGGDPARPPPCVRFPRPRPSVGGLGYGGNALLGKK